MRFQRWFWGLTAAMLYVSGMNDEVFDRLGDWWLRLGVGWRVGIVIALIATFVLVGARILRVRRNAYHAAIGAAGEVP